MNKMEMYARHTESMAPLSLCCADIVRYVQVYTVLSYCVCWFARAVQCLMILYIYVRTTYSTYNTFRCADLFAYK